MYVAFTRARDRLYLASATTDGVFKPRNGSLGEVLPESIRGLFASAAAATADGNEAAWSDDTGATHAFRICVPQAARASPACAFLLGARRRGSAQVRPADFGAVPTAPAVNVADQGRCSRRRRTAPARRG
jgi:hypothetical protein